MIHLFEQLFLYLLDTPSTKELVVLRISGEGSLVGSGFGLGLVLHKIAQGIFVLRLFLDKKNVGVCVAASLFDPLPSKDRILLLPLILVQRLNFLILVVQFVLDFHINSVVIVLGLSCLLAFALPRPSQRHLQLSY